jgi:hypothetical protein
MKTTLLLATATAALLVMVSSASAAEAFLSPRAKANLARPVTRMGVDMVDRSPQSGSPKGRELARSLRVVPSTGRSVDLAHGSRPLLSPKDPRYETALRELRAREFQVAPLK